MGETTGGSEREKLLNQAKSLLDQEEYDQALDCAKKAIEISPDNDVVAIEIAGEILLESGDVERARDCFSEAIARVPDGSTDLGYEKYLVMAQINEEGGHESVSLYNKAIEILFRLLQSNQESSKARDMVVKLCSSLCALAELYMTDLCMEPEAEQRCETYVQKSLELDSSNPENLVTLASMRISQQKPKGAQDALITVTDTWLDPQHVSNSALKFSAVRLLIETELYDRAVQVLLQLEKENDEIPDLWYLLGWCYFLQAERDDGETELYNDAKDCLMTCDNLIKRLKWEDEGISEHVAELLQILSSKNTKEVAEDEDDQSEGSWSTENEEMDVIG